MNSIILKLVVNVQVQSCVLPGVSKEIILASNIKFQSVYCDFSPLSIFIMVEKLEHS